MTAVRSDQFRRYVQDKLSDRGIICEDGPLGPQSQTGIEYKELIVTAGSFDDLCNAMTHAILAFSKRDPQAGIVNEKCLWRVGPEYDDGYSNSHRGYVRFAIVVKND